MRGGVYTPAILLLTTIVGISFLGFGFIVPLRTLYGREVGASSVEIGLMTSSFLLAGFVATPFVGRLSDRLGYKNVLWFGLLMHGLLILAYIPAQNPFLLIGLRALEGIAASSVLPPARALVNGLAPRARQGEALGLLSAFQMVGILIGPTLGTLLASQVGYAWSFVVASLPLFLSTVVALFVLPNARKTDESEAERALELASPTKLFTRPLVVTYSLQIVLSLIQGVAMAVWTLYMLDRGASLFLIGLSFTTFALPVILLAPIAGRLSDLYGRYRTLIFGLFLSSLIFYLYSAPITPLWVVILSIPEGVGAAFTRSAVDGLLADVMPMQAKGRVQAYYSAAGSLGSFIGATASGLVYVFGSGVPFFLEATLFLISAMLLFLPFLRRVFQIQPVSITLPLSEELEERIPEGITQI
jgi:MFS family permease